MELDSDFFYDLFLIFVGEVLLGNLNLDVL